MFSILAIWLSAHGPASLPKQAPKQALQCPSQIALDDLHRIHGESGWVLVAARPMYLSTAAIAAGPPTRKAQLVGESDWSRGKTTWVTKYKLDGQGFPEGKWLECSYGEYGEVMQTRRLDDGIANCTITHKPGKAAGQRKIEVTCR
ncbi:STY0301 family protein [Massilia sp. TS11]|uniref:STY0301 family protein n=1 Tax=Massilia sp. TS11 TaxID=2908003 RepID=UPI001EDA2BD7|nr:STY0301 family protein [Massilia sp. TS11]MCG2583569.1 hypothetical protein [Massilia sp. TS11]